MSADVAIEVESLGKTYPVYASPLDALKEVLTGKPRHTQAVALEGIDFRVRRGERVGIVGANGAGKSTLLRVLAGTIDHSAGRFRIAGTLRAVLELGTGFHEEYTGRDNILMGGMCLGYSRTELLERQDWIIDFAELRHVIDRPLRTYSTGMKMRLMYSVAFCKRVEIMIIDEALSAGDGAFVRKCTNHIVELCGAGTTALLVSHNLYFLERICHRVLYLRQGRLMADGDPLLVCKQYEQDLGRAFVASQVSQAAHEAPDTPADRLAAEPEPAPGAAAGAPSLSETVTAGASTPPSTPPPTAPHAPPPTPPPAPPDEPYLRSTGTRGALCPERAEPILPAAGDGFVDDRPLHPGLFEGGEGAPGGDKRANGEGQILQPDGRWELLDFTGAPAVRSLGLVRLLEARLYDADGRATEEIVTGHPCRFHFVLASRVRKSAVHVGFMLWNERGEHVATSTNVCSLDGRGRPNPRPLDLVEGTFAIDVVFPSLRLGAGRYTLRFGVAAGYEHYSVEDLLVSEDRCLAFAVLRPDHVQTVYYEPHSAWGELRRLAGVDAAALAPLDVLGPVRAAGPPLAVEAGVGEAAP